MKNLPNPFHSNPIPNDSMNKIKHLLPSKKHTFPHREYSLNLYFPLNLFFVFLAWSSFMRASSNSRSIRLTSFSASLSCRMPCILRSFDVSTFTSITNSPWLVAAACTNASVARFTSLPAI